MSERHRPRDLGGDPAEAGLGARAHLDERDAVVGLEDPEEPRELGLHARVAEHG
jgi:hypothetical protein